MQFENITLEYNGAAAIVTINRPKALNALNLQTLEELRYCLTELSGREEVAVVILTGGGQKSFVAGADISYMQKLEPLEARGFAKSCSFPVISSMPPRHCVSDLSTRCFPRTICWANVWNWRSG